MLPPHSGVPWCPSLLPGRSGKRFSKASAFLGGLQRFRGGCVAHWSNPVLIDWPAEKYQIPFRLFVGSQSSRCWICHKKRLLRSFTFFSVSVLTKPSLGLGSNLSPASAFVTTGSFQRLISRHMPGASLPLMTKYYQLQLFTKSLIVFCLQMSSDLEGLGVWFCVRCPACPARDVTPG